MQTLRSPTGVWTPSQTQRMSAAAAAAAAPLGAQTPSAGPLCRRWSAATKTCATTEAYTTWRTPGTRQVKKKAPRAEALAVCFY